MPVETHVDIAQACIEEVHAMRSRIPELGVTPPQLTRREMATVGSLPPEFVEAATNSRSVGPELLHATPVPPEKVRDLIVYANAYDALADQLEGLTRFIRQRTAEAKHIAGSEALATYAFAQRLARHPSTRHLSSEVETMRAALGARFRRKSKPEPPVPPVAEEHPRDED
jgi:hypothetical protein